jgi:hypothetical protein
MFAWIKSFFHKENITDCYSDSSLDGYEKHVAYLTGRDGYVTKDSFFELTGMKLYWLQKCAQTMTQKGYTVKQVRSTLEKHPGHLGGCQVRWYFTK